MQKLQDTVDLQFVYSFLQEPTVNYYRICLDD